MKKIVYGRADGGVAIVHPCRNIRETLSDKQVLGRAWRHLPSDAIKPRIVDEAEIPKDRSFRDAWTHDLTIDMSKAVDIFLKELRRRRNGKLEATDKLMMRAQETGNTAEVARLGAVRQALRDLPASIDVTAAATPEALKALFPKALLDESSLP